MKTEISIGDSQDEKYSAEHVFNYRGVYKCIEGDLYIVNSGFGTWFVSNGFFEPAIPSSWVDRIFIKYNGVITVSFSN